MWGQIKSQVSHLYVGKDVLDSEMAAAASVILPHVPSIQNFLVAVKVMTAGGGGRGTNNLYM
jgi:hypothetical protein